VTAAVTHAVIMAGIGTGGTVTVANQEAEAIVPINAGTRTGYTFANWTSTPAVTFANQNNASTTFVMPNTAVTVTANWTHAVSEVFTIRFEHFQHGDRAPPDLVFPGFVSLTANHNIPVDDPEGLFGRIRWFIGADQIHEGPFLPLNATTFGSAMGMRFITVVVEIAGVQYGRRIALTVIP